MTTTLKKVLLDPRLRYAEIREAREWPQYATIEISPLERLIGITHEEVSRGEWLTFAWLELLSDTQSGN